MGKLRSKNSFFAQRLLVVVAVVIALAAFGIVGPVVGQDGSFEGQTISVAGPGFIGEGLVALIPAFEQATGATIEYSDVPDIRDKVTADFTTGTGIFDVVVAPFTFLHEWQVGGFLLPLDEHIANDPDLYPEDFIPALYQAYGDWDDQHWSIPYHADVYLFFYRKDLFEDPEVQEAFRQQVGRDLKVPQTTDELIETARFFTQSINPDSPVPYGWVQMATPTVDSMWSWSSRLAALGRGYLDEGNNPDFNNDAGLQAADVITQLLPTAPENIGEYGFTDVVTSFLGGKAAMAELWNPMADFSLQSDGFWGETVIHGNVGFAMLPGVMVDGELQQSSILGGFAASISAFTDNEDLAYAFISFVNSQQSELIKVGVIGLGGTRTSTYKNPGILAEKPYYPAMLENLAQAHINADVDAPPVGAQLQEILYTNLHRVWIGEIDAATALADTEADWNQILSQAGLIE